jgi:peptidoglycan/LPS O-acetylase OafA/YrhL
MHINTNYRPEIDGLRCIAILAVLAAHYKLKIFEGGYVGVDVFFVISGYLITSIICSKLQADTFSFKDFYIKRILRIMPALFSTIILTAFASYFIFMPEELIKTGKSGLAAIFSLANIYFWQNMGYFDGASIEKPFLHTWSLSVEEQFYLLFPLCMFLAYRYTNAHLRKLLFTTAIVSLIIASWGAYEKPTAAFFYL